MRTLAFTSIIILTAVVARAEPILPTAPGMTWRYQSTEEVGGPAAAAPTTAAVTVKEGRETFEGTDFLKFETATEEIVTKIELITVDDHGVLCHFRGGKDGRMARLDPPQTIVPATLKAGDSWESDGEVAGMEMQQHFTAVGEESIRVPAGNFRAFHIRCQGTSVISVTLDRWFARGVGVIKEVTLVRGPTGGLLQRTTLELQAPPEIVAEPEPAPSVAESSPTATATTEATAEEKKQPFASGKRLVVEVSPEAGGGMKTEFKSDVQNIYVRWQGRGLPEGARVRVAWVAEDVGDLVDPNFIIDETESVAPASDARARFTLARPPDGWAEGKYRVEFYVNDELEETVRVTIR
jgi:hypothetical protein